MNHKNVLVNLILGIIFLSVSALTLMGTMGNFIKFQSSLNEFVCAGISAVGGLLCLIAASIKDGTLN